MQINFILNSDTNFAECCVSSCPLSRAKPENLMFMYADNSATEVAISGKAINIAHFFWPQLRQKCWERKILVVLTFLKRICSLTCIKQAPMR